MKSLFGIIIASVFFAVLSVDARATERSSRHISSNGEFSFQVESRGRVLPVYNYRGKSYVEGRYGNSYSIRVYNHTSRRVEAVVTVDGRDVISGRPGNYRSRRGYVISPYDSVLIEGFRSSMNNVAAFTFTGVEDSYAARMGDASNVGVVGVAIFKEDVPRREPIRPYYQYKNQDRREERDFGTGYKRSPAPPAEKGAAESAPRRRSKSSSSVYESAEASGQGLGTGYGEDTYSPATNTYFKRSSRRPNVVLSVRYDDKEGLYARGVLPAPLRYRPAPRPEPFPETPAFAPPPPRRR
jgi:hypothetical protein